MRPMWPHAHRAAKFDDVSGYSTNWKRYVLSF